MGWEPNKVEVFWECHKIPTLGCQIDEYTHLFGTKETWRKKQTQRQTKVFNKNPPYSFIWPYSFNWHLRVLTFLEISHAQKNSSKYFYISSLFCLHKMQQKIEHEITWLNNFYWLILKNCFRGSRDRTNHARSYNELFTYFKFDGMKSDQVKNC